LALAFVFVAIVILVVVAIVVAIVIVVLVLVALALAGRWWRATHFAARSAQQVPHGGRRRTAEVVVQIDVDVNRVRRAIMRVWSLPTGTMCGAGAIVTGSAWSGALIWPWPTRPTCARPLRRSKTRLPARTMAWVRIRTLWLTVAGIKSLSAKPLSTRPSATGAAESWSARALSWLTSPWMAAKSLSAKPRSTETAATKTPGSAARPSAIRSTARLPITRAAIWPTTVTLSALGSAVAVWASIAASPITVAPVTVAPLASITFSPAVAIVVVSRGDSQLNPLVGS
jgi:hypothetical protein